VTAAAAASMGATAVGIRRLAGREVMG
jgi:hypothetical protein